MGNFVLLAVVFAIAFAGIAAAAWKAMEHALRRWVVERHRDLEEIALTGDVPQSWQAEPEQTYVRRLDRLHRYVEKSSLVESESVRRELLEVLTDVRSRWATSRR